MGRTELRVFLVLAVLFSVMIGVGYSACSYGDRLWIMTSDSTCGVIGRSSKQESFGWDVGYGFGCYGAGSFQKVTYYD